MKKKLTYFLAVYEDEKVGFWGNFADFDCCVVQAKTLEDLTDEAIRVLDEDVADMVENGKELPTPSIAKEIKSMLDKEDGELFCLVPVTVYPPAKTERINITMKGDILARIDDFSRIKNINRSKLMVNATLEYMAQHA